MFVRVHINQLSVKTHALHLQTQTLLFRALMPELDLPACPDDTMPGQNIRRVRP